MLSNVTSLLGAFLGFGLNNMSTSSTTYQSQINELTDKVDYLLQFAPTPEVIIPTKKATPTAVPSKKATSTPTPAKTTKAKFMAACNPAADKKPVGFLICDPKTSKWAKLPTGSSTSAQNPTGAQDSETANNG